MSFEYSQLAVLAVGLFVVFRLSWLAWVVYQKEWKVKGAVLAVLAADINGVFAVLIFTGAAVLNGDNNIHWALGTALRLGIFVGYHLASQHVYKMLLVIDKESEASNSEACEVLEQVISQKSRMVITKQWEAQRETAVIAAAKGIETP